MFRLHYDDRVLVARLSDLEKRQLPFATMLALNDSMFDVRTGWQREIGNVFDKPAPLTVNAVLFKKATKDNLVAEVFLRNEASKGTPPSRYLRAEVEGNARDEKPVEHLLRRAGIIAGDEFVVTARGAPVDQYGNIPGKVVTTMLSDLQAARDSAANASAATRAKRERRKSFKGRAVYFLSRGAEDIGGGKIQHLPRGIYQRTRFSSGSAIKMIFVIVKGSPTYKKRFDAFKLAQGIFNESFPRRFRTRLADAVRTARIK